MDLSRDWLIHQLYVKNAFLNGHLAKTINMHQPLVLLILVILIIFVSCNILYMALSRHPKLGLSGLLIRIDFSHSRRDSSLFIYLHGTNIAYLLILQDIVVKASSSTLMQRIVCSLNQEFDVTDLGVLNYFWGTSVIHDRTRMFLTQRKYALELLKRANMIGVP